MSKSKLAASLTCLLLVACSTSPQGGRQWQVSPLLSVQDGAGDADGWYQLGRVQLAQDRLESAESALRHALELEPRHGLARSALGVLLARRGDLAGAVSAFQAAVEEGAAPGAYNNLGYALYLQGKYAEAADALGKASALDPGNPRIWRNLEMALARKGDTERAGQARAHVVELAGTAAAVARTVPAPPEQAGAVLVELASGLFEIREQIREPAAPQAVADAGKVPGASFRLEIANGNGVPGLAKRMGARLAADGLPKARLGNQKPFVQPVTEIQYREGFAAAASRVGAKLPGVARLRSLGPGAGKADVRLVLGHDLREPRPSSAVAAVPKAEDGAQKKPS